MRRQPPIARCFAALCFSSAVLLVAFEWRNPFPEPVVTLETVPDISGAEFVALNQIQPQARPERFRLFSFLSADARSQQPTSLDNTSIQLVLSLAQRSLEVRGPEGEPIATYKVAVGQADWQTPTGEFVVLSKLENPAWQHPITQEEIAPGPENPLGSRWIGFWTDGKAQIGFHGTNQEELIGEAVSHGCVRMRNQDIEALYEWIEPGTSVKVMP